MFRTTVCVWFLVIMAILKFRKGTDHCPFLLHLRVQITSLFSLTSPFPGSWVIDNEGDRNPLLLIAT